MDVGVILWIKSQSEITWLQKVIRWWLQADALSVQDVEEYSQLNFDYLLDEAQVMKNAQTKIAHHLRNFEVKIPLLFLERRLKITSANYGLFSNCFARISTKQRTFLKLPVETVARFDSNHLSRWKQKMSCKNCQISLEAVLSRMWQMVKRLSPSAAKTKCGSACLLPQRNKLNRSKMEILSGLRFAWILIPGRSYGRLSVARVVN